MKSATVRELKQELTTLPQGDLVDLCLRLSKFKKENKELLTYLIYEAANEDAYIQSVKVEVEELFDEINTTSYYYIKKSVRKILRLVKKYIRYSKKRVTEVELLIHFCQQLKMLNPPYHRNVSLTNIYTRQLSIIDKAMAMLHDDLQFDYRQLILELSN